MRKPPGKRKLSKAQYAARFAAEQVLQQRRYCEAFALWRQCPLKRCRRNGACRGDPNLCLKRALDRVPRHTQWQARQDILIATPDNIGAPERAARQCMPHDFYEGTTAPPVANSPAIR
ncbi:MAG: hypothetical protein WAK63_14135 [Xanthobacteraceae bacterium]